jgi:hypothetical protein
LAIAMANLAVLHRTQQEQPVNHLKIINTNPSN